MQRRPRGWRARRRLRRDVQLRDRQRRRDDQLRIDGIHGHHTSTTVRYCGSGSLAITALFSGSSGPTVKGEVLIPLPGAPVDLTGKTITVHVAADPGCSADLNLSLVLNTQAGPIYFTSDFPIPGVSNTWKTKTTTVPAASGSTTALQISLQAFSTKNYQGTIYIDEVDVR